MSSPVFLTISVSSRGLRVARIFVTQPIPEEPLHRLRGAATVEIYPDPSRIIPYDLLLAGIKSCEVLYCLLHDTIDARMVNEAPGLRLIATSAIVPTNVDVDAAAEKGIPVTVIPNIVSESTADLQWGLLVAIARRIVESDRAVRRGLFPGAQSTYFTGGDVSGKTLGTIGLGAIGRAIARRAHGFSMRVLYTKRDRLSPEDEAALAIGFRGLDDLLTESDFVVINAAYHPGTYHLLGARELSLMKPTAYLVNTARGPIVDEDALVAALKQAKIAGAALDVYEYEPRVHPELSTLERVILTPHIGSATRDTRERIASIVVDNILAYLRGDALPNLYDAQAIRA